MSAITTTQQVDVNSSNRAKITCPNCSNTKVADVAKLRNSKSAIKAKCSCGSVFSVSLKDLRKFYRKKVKLPGSYLRTDEDMAGIITVTDLSFSGIGFKTEKEHDIEVDDILGVRFMLDDGKKTELRRTVIVRNVRGNSIGTEFCDSHGFDMELCYYLILS